MTKNQKCLTSKNPKRCIGIIYCFDAYFTMGHYGGLSIGGATLMGTLSASASYIAAPAAIRLSLPEANPALYLTSSLTITFPFNITIGIPVFYAIARHLGN